VIDEFYAAGGFFKIRGGDAVLCHAHSFCERGIGDECKANARLISAAPEMLAALKEAARDFAIMRSGACMEKWDAVIAKAEGRT